MDGRFVLEVPASVTTRFLVATEALELPAPDRLPDAAGHGALAREAAAMLKAGGLVVEPVTRPSGDLKARFHRLATPPGRLGAVVGARRHVAVTAAGPPAGQPRTAQAARLAARALAAAVGGTVADLDSRRILPGAPPAVEPEAFALGRAWVSVFVTLDPADAARARIDTAGLHRFGLPEAAARHVPYASMLTAANLVRGLAWQLVAEQTAWLGRGRRDRARATRHERAVSAADVLRFWGTGPPGGAFGDAGSVTVRLGWTGTDCPDCAAAIEVVPPVRLSRSAGAPDAVPRASPPPCGPAEDPWWRDAADTMPKIARASPDPPG
ncbi:hypothetical protein [Actinomadura verrucosospora]|uniref:Uncharacterized protein n=1 Tax=Actinomadura verrucosospora TaxID=46165 RepID=A0A7D3VTE7_ACTVE|nr:hypothetical protein [Actinomadura verrucosospora]QKG18532.1 hypothetical protein ACTIVE_0166 [Actinomadura verrucosospora]